MQIFSKYSPKRMVTTIVSAVVFLKKNIRVRQAKSCDLFLQSQVTTYLRNITCQNSFLLYCFLEKRKKQDKIPFLVTKRGQNLIWKSDPNPRPLNCVWTYLLLSSQNARNIENLRGGGKTHKIPPPAVFEVTIWERISWSVYMGNEWMYPTR